jgi:hypothetical protein
VGGCATQQHIDSRLGQILPDIGLVVGAGQVGGHDWMVGTRVEANVICNTLYLDDAAQAGACAGMAVIGTNDLSVSGKGGQPNVIAGFADATVTSVEVGSGNTSFAVPVVPLHLLGLAGSAFGVYVPPGVKLGELRFIDGQGNIVERQPLPQINVQPTVEQ